MTARVLAIAIAVGLAALALAATDARADVSPGPLSRDHAALEGVDRCTDCHSGGDAISASKCLSCHKALDLRLTAKAGYHAGVSRDCASCHPDHRGVDKPLVRWPGGKRDAFDHGKLASYKIEGAHVKVDCKTCHAPKYLAGTIAAALTAEERPRTYLALPRACSGCHDDVHKPSLGADCERCHDASAWRTATMSTGFDHGKTRYPLTGGHAQVACTKCHGGTPNKLAELHPKFDTCKTCHQDPHAGAMGTAPTACATCHTTAAWATLVYPRRTHAPKTLPLELGHAPPACADCHGKKVDAMPKPACVGCHADPHRPSLGTTCQQCHRTSSWLDRGAPANTPTSIAFHDRTAYPLRGLHVQVACAKCHDPRVPAARRFRPIAHDACKDCHADPHQGQTTKPCERCHAVEGWEPARFEVADHAATRYPLDGAHRAVACAGCHPASPAAPGFNAGAPACETCHADPHGGQFVGKGTCATCHATAGWSPSTFTKEAHAKAGMALVGEHDVACARCHGDAGGTRATPATFVGLSNDCATCHTDRHAGQFASRACTSCHAGAVWKPTPGFDHAATFALRGRHSAAPCASCHPTLPIAAMPTVPRTEVYLLGAALRECSGCHRDQHGDASSTRAQPRRLAAGTRACKDCHDETRWAALGASPAFDHDLTGAPLVGGHTKAPCGSCHRADRRLVGMERCDGCHADRHGGRLGDRCEACHTPSTWKQDRLLEDHRRTRLPLVGAHAVQGCPSCHRDAARGDYRGLDPSCRSCHYDTVAERRPHPAHDGTAFLTCEHCHSALGWRPASIDHDRYWPLTGAHKPASCARCHAPGEPYNAAPTACLDCHRDDLAAGQEAVDHTGFDDDCATCHTTTSWEGATFDHTTFFPLRGHHDVSCATCHTTPGMNESFSCITGSCHRRGSTDREHDDVSGYRYDSRECYRCHPDGRE